MALRALALDEGFGNLGNIPYINLQWSRSYYTCGTFVIQMLAKDYDPSIAYVYSPDRPETGIVQKTTYQKKRSGEYVLLSGFFLEKMLDDAITWTSEASPTFFADGNVETELRRMVTMYKGNVPIILGPVAGLGDDVEFQATGKELGMECYKRLQAQGLSYRCAYNKDDDKIYFSIWQGKDRTQGQSQNSFATFSSEFGNLGKVEVTIDKSNYKNFAVVGGEGEGDNRYYEQADASGGGYLRKVLIDSRNARFDPTEQTQAQYRADLRQDGFDGLKNDYYIIENAKITAAGTAAAIYAASGVGAGTSLIYMEDYDLGDLCDVVLSDIGIEIAARIINVHEVIKRKQHLIEIEFGEAILTRTEKARL